MVTRKRAGRFRPGSVATSRRAVFAKEIGAHHLFTHRDQTSYRQPGFEATIELVYRYQVAPWCSIQPHAQYVVRPGATTERDDALILGLRTNITF